MSEVEELKAELLKVDAIINAAYWTFTRCKRSRPPVLVCPDAYARRKFIEARLRELQR